MKLPKNVKSWVLSGCVILACNHAHAVNCSSPADDFGPVSQIAGETEKVVTEFNPAREYASLSSEERQSFSDRVQDLRSLAKDRLAEASALDAELAQQGDCGSIKTVRGCLQEKVKELSDAGKDTSKLEQILNRPSLLRQSAQQLNELADAGDQLRSGRSLSESLKSEASGVYATFRDSWRYMIRKEPLVAVTIGMAGYLAAKPYTNKTSAHFNDPAHKWTGAKYQVGNALGQGYTILLPAWIAAKYSGNEKLSQVADDWIAGGIMDGLIVTGMKYAVREKRPDGSDNLGFPSGHTTTAFMMATIVQEEMGSKWGIPAYVLASYVGMSRIGGAKHTPGQVAAGAGLGYAIGWSVAQASSARRAKEEGPMNGNFRVGNTKVQYQAVPALTPSGTGMLVDFSW